jgi:acyl-CoA reductase-like NAD-dependent aldehyde dehydrogenase
MRDPVATAVAHIDPMPAGERRSLLTNWADRIGRRAEDLARAITTATRKPIRLARAEVGRGAEVVRQTAAAMDRIAAVPVDLGGAGLAEVHLVPVGPVLAVTPFNFPLNLPLHKIAPALAAGCPVLWKPSAKAPGVAELAHELLVQAGAPPALVQILAIDDAATRALAADPRLGLVSVTASVVAGRELQAAARARVVLELGGANAVILHDPVDAAAAARLVAVGACAHAGQVCSSVQRIFVPEGRDDLVDALDRAFRDLPTGDPWDERTVCGPVIDQAARDRIDGHLRRLQAAGGRCRTGGTWDGLVLAPTLIDGLPAHAPGVADTEAFAPLATVHRYRDLPAALHQVDCSPFGLQAGLFARDEADIRLAFHLLQVGTLVIDDVPTRRDDRLPFGGMKASGLGREGTAAGILDLVQPKVLWRPHA